MKRLAFDPVTILSRLENLRDSVTDEKKPPWPGDFVVSPVAALSIVPMGVTFEIDPIHATKYVCTYLCLLKLHSDINGLSDSLTDLAQDECRTW